MPYNLETLIFEWNYQFLMFLLLFIYKGERLNNNLKNELTQELSIFI